MKLLLDEMWSPAIARELRKRGHDAHAVAERNELRGQPDGVIFATACAEERAVVTENVVDYRSLAADALRAGRSHPGVIFTLHRTLPRGDPRTPGRLVKALTNLLAADQGYESLEYWIP